MMSLFCRNAIKSYKKFDKAYTNNFVRYFNKTSILNEVQAKPLLRQPQSRAQQIGPLGWFLLVIPVSTFGLGTWQVQRKKWKEDLIARLQALTNADPIKLPKDLKEIEALEYRPVHVRGHFLHDREIYLGPRTLLVKGDASTKSQLMTSSTNRSQGYLVITPFKLSDRDEIILVNRGWVPAKNRNPKTREEGQNEGEVDVIGIVRLHEPRPQFTPKNQGDSNLWLYRDLYQMAEATGAVPVLLDATNDFDVPGGPIGGQTRVTLRNEHLSYVFTWYSLCAATSYMWYRHFFQRLKR